MANENDELGNDGAPDGTSASGPQTPAQKRTAAKEAKAKPDADAKAQADADADAKAKADAAAQQDPPADPPPAAAPAPQAATFSRERLLGPDGERIVGHPSYLIAGALAGNDANEYTREQAVGLVEQFLTREITTED